MLKKLLSLEQFLNEGYTPVKMDLDVKKQQVYFVDRWHKILGFIKDYPDLIEYSIEYVNDSFTLAYNPTSKIHKYLNNSKQRGNLFTIPVKSRKVLNLYLSEEGSREENYLNDINRIKNRPNYISHKYVNKRLVKVTFLNNEEEETESISINKDGTIEY